MNVNAVHQLSSTVKLPPTREEAIARRAMATRDLLLTVARQTGRSVDAVTADDVIYHLQMQRYRQSTMQPVQSNAIASNNEPSPPSPEKTHPPHRGQADFEQSLSLLNKLFHGVSPDCETLLMN